MSGKYEPLIGWLGSVDQVREAARRMPTAERREVLAKLREAVRDLEEAETEEAEAAKSLENDPRPARARNSDL